MGYSTVEVALENKSRQEMAVDHQGINSIREEQDLEDSGAYGTTPSKDEATLNQAQKA